MTSVLARLLTVLHILFGIVAIGGSIIGVTATYATGSSVTIGAWAVLIALTALYARTIIAAVPFVVLLAAPALWKWIASGSTR